MRQKYAEITELYILQSELSRRKLSPMLATAHYSCGYPDNVNSLGVLNWVSFWTQLGENFRITTNVYVDQTLCTSLINCILIQIETQRILK